MKRRRFVRLVMGAACLTSCSESRNVSSLGGGSQNPSATILGMYVHEGWPYNHPYAARTWTVEDWRGYADGLKKLGYNMLIIWPALETMPQPLTPSDRANIDRTAQVIDVLHRELGMRALVTICPNIGVNNPVALKYSFEQRPLYASMEYLNPSDPTAMSKLFESREELLRPLAQMDGLVVIDSDPGGYPGSTNDQFVEIMVQYRKLLDRLRPGIELRYWLLAGWETYSHILATGEFTHSTLAETEDALTKLKKAGIGPWGITVHTTGKRTNLDLAKKMGLAANSLAFNYGAIEGEPSFPMTNFGGSTAFDAGAAGAPGGVVGNAQTHCVQLPNTFAFARGAKGLPVAEPDYVQFANDLIVGQGQLLVAAWKALASEDSKLMHSTANTLGGLDSRELTPGPLRGLMFGSPTRFVSDLVHELQMKAAYLDFVAASKDKVSKEGFRRFLTATKAWQGINGFQVALPHWPHLKETLKKLHSPSLDRLLDDADWRKVNSVARGNSPFERFQDFCRKIDNYGLRLIKAMEGTLKNM